MPALTLRTEGKGFYPLNLQDLEGHFDSLEGHLLLFCQHTSCALAINENFDPSAKLDMEEFFERLVPENRPWIKHTAEGPDDSPAHLKSLLLQPSLNLIVSGGEIFLGRWQGIFLCEFRSAPQTRTLVTSFCPKN